MNGGFLPDTNIPSELMRLRPEPKVKGRVAAQDISALFLSVVSIGELETASGWFSSTLGIRHDDHSIGRSLSYHRWRLPALIADGGDRVAPCFLEFFTVNIRNTRATNARAVGDFLRWCEGQGVTRSARAAFACRRVCRAASARAVGAESNLKK